MALKSLVWLALTGVLILTVPGYSQDVIIQEEPAAPVEKKLGAIRLAAHYGFSYLTAEIPSNLPTFLQDYFRELNSGSNVAGEATYYMNRQFGIGLKYARFHTKNTITGLVMHDPDTNMDIYGGITDDVVISFIGATGTARNRNRSGKFLYMASAAVGMAGYTDNYDFFGVPATEEGSTMGVMLGLSGDLMLSGNVALGVELNLLIGTIYDITTDGKPSEGEMDINRFDLNAGLRFYL